MLHFCRSLQICVSFVITYLCSLKNVGKIINENVHILYTNEKVKSVFTVAPMISFHSTKKLSLGKTLLFRKNRQLSLV